MNLVSLLKIVLSLASKLAEYVRDKQLMDAGAARATLAGIHMADAAIAKAEKARANPTPIDKDEFNRDNKP